MTQVDREQSNSHRYPQFLPNGRDFLFLARSAEEGVEHAVMVGSLDGREPRRIVRSAGQARYASGHLLYLRERTLVAQRFDPDRVVLESEAMPVAENVRLVSTGTAYGVFSVSDNGRLLYTTGSGGKKLQWIDRNGRDLQSLEDVADYRHVSLSPDGNRAAVGIFDEVTVGNDLWVVDLERGVRSRLTADAAPEGPAIWSPLGDAVIYPSNLHQDFDLFQSSIIAPVKKPFFSRPTRTFFPKAGPQTRSSSCSRETVISGPSP